MRTKLYTTGQAAAKAGITRATLQAWISAKKIRAPKVVTLGKITVRMWSASDVRQLQHAKEILYCKGRGRKSKAKRQSV
jgi:excisionase family DNA binding protein